MKFILITLFSALFALSIKAQSDNYTLNDYFSNNEGLENKVDSVFNELSRELRVAQLLMPAVGRYGQHTDTIRAYVKDGIVGGVLLLNGTKSQFTNWVNEFNKLNKPSGNLPFLYSADAEPSLVNRKIINSQPVAKANAITSEDQVRDVAKTISKDLNDIGINYNFSPVADLSPNKTVGYRGFGTKKENIIPFCNAFIEETQNKNIIATAKHFPGHGLVSGDTHKSLQVIDGDLKELMYYPPIIENRVLSIMVAHIAVRNNAEFSTNGLPATTSKKIVKDLLRDSLNFQGLIVTDAMNMGGVTQVKDAEIKAIEAGCDIVLMPLEARKKHQQLVHKYTSSEEFQEAANQSIKRVIRAKICLGLL